MTEQSWQLRQGERLVGTLTLESGDMFWSDCRFRPGPAWEELAPLFASSRDAWRRGDEDAALAADETIYAQDLALVPEGSGAPITEFLIRIEGEVARFRH
ncbi:hypothetical protein OG912_38440 (plasmid) [Streptomyces sp. NBC_00464]|uniref:hypothetical protein n=1 Tax=Streptomyces sp. NBC_00464 TaxID=2975751 RepID=UPI002E197251